MSGDLKDPGELGRREWSRSGHGGVGNKYNFLMLRTSMDTIGSRKRSKISAEKVFAIFMTITNVMGKIAILTFIQYQRRCSRQHIFIPL